MKEIDSKKAKIINKNIYIEGSNSCLNNKISLSLELKGSEMLKYLLVMMIIIITTLGANAN